MKTHFQILYMYIVYNSGAPETHFSKTSYSKKSIEYV